MSYKNNISMPRGTSLSVSIKIYNFDGTSYELSDTDVVRFGVKLDKNESNYRIVKVATYDTENDCYVFEINPEDTAELPFDRYKYDVGLQTVDGRYYMIITAADFNVTTAITAKE